MAEVVYMLRHAAPPAEAQGRYWGRRDPGVDPAELDTVSGVSSLLWRPPTRLLASPLSRTLVTAEALAANVSLSVEVQPGLAEIDFGFFEGMKYPEVSAAFPRQAAKWAAVGDAFHFPGGESVAAFLDRSRQAWEHCVGLPDSSVLAVTHGGVIAAWCCLFLRMSFRHRHAFRPGYAALTAFVAKKDVGGWELAFFNNRL